MENVFVKTEELAENIKDYFNAKIELVKLSTVEKSSAIMANLIAGFALVMVLIFFVFFAGMALAYGLGDWLGNTWLGFLIVACTFLLLGIIVWMARGKIIRLPIMNSMIKQLIKEDETVE